MRVRRSPRRSILALPSFGAQDQSDGSRIGTLFGCGTHIEIAVAPRASRTRSPPTGYTTLLWGPPPNGTSFRAESPRFFCVVASLLLSEGAGGNG